MTGIETIINRLQAKSENAYIGYINAHRKDECLGWEAKVLHNKFGEKELKAHKKAQEWFGKHCAYLDAIEVIKEESSSPSHTLPSTHGPYTPGYVSPLNQARDAIKKATGRPE
jgi:hypothetical protein